MNKNYAKERIRHFKKHIKYWTAEIKRYEGYTQRTADQEKWYQECQKHLEGSKESLKYYEEKLNEQGVCEKQN